MQVKHEGRLVETDVRQHQSDLLNDWAMVSGQARVLTHDGEESMGVWLSRELDLLPRVEARLDKFHNDTHVLLGDTPKSKLLAKLSKDRELNAKFTSLQSFGIRLHQDLLQALAVAEKTRVKELDVVAGDLKEAGHLYRPLPVSLTQETS